MRKGLIYFAILTFLLVLASCQDFLELQPLDRVSKEYLLSSPAGAKTLLATLYNKMPIEDFNYIPGTGYNQHPATGNSAGDGGWSLASNTDEAIIIGPNDYRSSPATNLDQYWDYTSIRYVNQFLKDIENLKSQGKLSAADYKQFYGEAVFIRAYMYFALAKRYGGVPIITAPQSLPINDVAEVRVPRSTEKATWNFILSQLDMAIDSLPSDRPSDSPYRATKWVALALKSRVALHAASVAKFWQLAPLSGTAVDSGYVGNMTITDANNYYLQCINASKAIIDNNKFQLYKPTPASKDEAAKNYQDIFENPTYSNPEIIYLKAYIDGSSTGSQGHMTDYWFYPKQLCYQTLYMSSRWGTTLDIVDVFEDYTDDGTGASAPIKTRVDGVENYNVAIPATLTSVPYDLIRYNSQYEPFMNKDARLRASVLLPGSSFKGVLINMQGGFIRPNGRPVIYTTATETVNGVTYYTYGSPNESGYSAFGAIGTAQANYSSTGFALRKFLQDTRNVTSTRPYGSTQSWIDFRLAEIYLNYAEAVIESGQGDATLAASLLNALRKRAGHTDNIPLSVENVLKERRVELIFEDHRYWDLIRRRTFHELFNKGIRLSLIPLQDLRVDPPKYVFLRVQNFYDNKAGGLTFQMKRYYQNLPVNNANMLIQNPEW